MLCFSGFMYKTLWCVKRHEGCEKETVCLCDLIITVQFFFLGLSCYKMHTCVCMSILLVRWTKIKPQLDRRAPNDFQRIALKLRFEQLWQLLSGVLTAVISVLSGVLTGVILEEELVQMTCIYCSCESPPLWKTERRIPLEWWWYLRRMQFRWKI